MNSAGKVVPFALALIVLLAVAVVGYQLYWAQGEADVTRPNIVIVLADDLGWGDVGAYNPAGKIQTPNIDQLAAEGLRFTDAHSGTAVCSPTRYGLLTGRHFLRESWIKVQYQIFAPMIDAERLTLAEMLQANGYHTGAFGKWHLGQSFYTKEGEITGPGPLTDWSKPTTGGANDQGFDEYFGSAFTHGQFLRAFMHNRLVTEVPTDFPGTLAGPGTEDFDPAAVMPMTTEKVLEYLDWNAEHRPGQPFFAYVAPVAVHNPLTPAPDFVGTSDAGAYGDFAVQLDADVGKIIAKLDAMGVAENTLLVVTSDNGSPGYVAGTKEKPLPRLGSVEKRFGHRVNGPWRGYKGQLWEGGHRVPLVIRWPAVIEAGGVSNQLFLLEDFMATIAAILQIQLPADSAHDSYNALPELTGEDYSAPRRDYAVFSTFNGDPVVRKGDWVLAFHLGSGGQFTSNKAPQAGGPEGQLYNLHSDPAQKRNVWLEHPDIVEDLTALYDLHTESGRSLGVSR